MSKEELQREFLEVLKSGKIQPTTIIMGDNVQNKIEKVESGGVVNINSGQMDEQKTTTANTSDKEYCEYICIEKVLEQGIYTLDEFEAMMAKAAKGTAPELAAFLKRYHKQGLLDFKGHTKKQIFDNLGLHFPEMRDYDYPNFAAAF